MALGLALVACDPAPDPGPVRVVAIGPAATVGGPGLPSRLLTDATAQGLVRFDAGGQVEPGLAQRWIVADGGTSYIFRLRDARWADGSPVTAEQVAARLRRQIARRSRNPLAPFLTAIDEIVAMTPQVIEVRLKRPRPDLLKLFAQPEFGLLRPGRGGGTGPLLATGDMLSRPPGPDQPGQRPRDEARFVAARASAAVMRFVAGEADLVAGGTLVDWPLVAAAAPPAVAVRLDPAVGLFGLLIVRREGFLAAPAHRAAVAQAFDRAAIVATAPGWAATEQLLPDQLDSALPPQAPAWAVLPLDARQAAARATVAAWGKPVRLRIALPPGPGATQLWGQLGAALVTIGITPERVAPGASADLRLIDAVAPYDSARWYLAVACQPCGGEALAKVFAARDAPTMPDRARLIAEADAALAADTSFIPLARPLRWSLVSPRLTAWQPNPRAWHPLNHLRDDPR